MFFYFIFLYKKEYFEYRKKEIIENNSMVVTFNEDLDKKIYNYDLETDYNNQKIIERRHYSNPLYEFWTLGGRYTTYSFYYKNRFREYCTFISNLDGFSDAIIVGNFGNYDIGNLTDNDIRANTGMLLFLYENNGYYSFREFHISYNNYSNSKNYSFEINDNGVIILTSLHSFMDNNFKNYFKIRYKYHEDKLILYNYLEYEYIYKYPYIKEYNLEMIKFIYMKNKLILRNYNKNENDEKYDIVYINEDTADLKNLYIAVLRRSFFDIITTISDCRGDLKDLQDIPGLLKLYFLTKKEVSIFENCIYEYFNGKSEDELKLINKEIIFDLLKEIKKE